MSSAVGRDYHLEYGYSCMGYEVAGGVGAKMAFLSGTAGKNFSYQTASSSKEAEREVFVTTKFSLVSSILD